MTDTTCEYSISIIARHAPVVVEGWYHPTFENVAQAFAASVTGDLEDGASLCIHHEGQIVVNLWGGYADRANGRPWTRDTVSLIFSATKAATAVCIHMLEERGKLCLEQPVAEIWPEFAKNGKDAITIRMVLDHTAGLPVVATPLKTDCLTDHVYMADMIAAAEPVWVAGARTAYHPLIGGFILAEIIRRIDGRTLGRYFSDEIAIPLNLDFWIGLPEDIEPRVAPMIPYRSAKDQAPTPFSNAIRDMGSLQNLWFFNHGDWQAGGMNTRPGRAAEIGAANGITNAQGLAGFYEALKPGNVLNLSQDRIHSFCEASSATHLDGMFLQPIRFGPGFMLRMDNRTCNRGDSVVIGRSAFGHVGAGGSIGFRDLDADLAFAYTMNRMGPGFLLNDRGQSLVDTTYQCLERFR